MQAIAGTFKDGKISRGCAAELRATPSARLEVYAAEGGVQAERLAAAPLDEVQISSRLGSTPRHLTFPDGEIMTVTDNDALDAMLHALAPSKTRGLVHFLESHWLAVATSVLITIVLAFFGVRDGVPASAEFLAHKLPQSAMDTTAEATMKLLDSRFVGPTKLSDARQQTLHARFTPVLQQFPDMQLRVLFRDGQAMGANAFALPDGTLVFTDQIVEAAETDEELVAVLAHEIGHVAHRHSMRSVIQDSMLVTAYTLMLGDASGTAEIFLGLPIVLTEMHYSRGFEEEADQFALDWMQANAMNPQHFVEMMNRIAGDSCVRVAGKSSRKLGNAENGNEVDPESCDSGLSKYFSTHPPTHERLEKFMGSEPKF
ncbi:M48 family metallopeptidase [Biformimicrobium ophioploci]|uniref:M48 family metallopeptidase n=1 Tax=Biformimicrobium ophioploci TaxID=3036711 RepID=A0ABQ6LWW5_9GAMM|nr:M48 family metallopeptidase [Microbulbifer sp. NKW57]GMG86556.1 M48 family metallopeptidase [Microbulbifer sp. NKW57]